MTHSNPQGLAVDSQHIYWADAWSDNYDNPIMEANIDGTNVQTFVADADGPSFVAVDGAVVTPPPSGGGGTVTTSGGTPTPVHAVPTALTDAAVVTGPMTATVYGRVGPNGESTTYHFDYGLNTAYGQRAPATNTNAGAGTSLTAASASLTGLQPTTTYHYRVVATSAGGTTNGVDRTFTTPTACQDRLGPVSRFNLAKTVITRNGLHAVGTTTDRGGCTSNVLDARDGGGVAKVMISFALQTRSLNTPLKPGMKWGNPVSVHVWTYNFVANGKHNWTFDLKLKLKPGLYRVFAMGYDLRGNRERYDPMMRNGILIRVK